MRAMRRASRPRLRRRPAPNGLALLHEFRVAEVHQGRRTGKDLSQLLRSYAFILLAAVGGICSALAVFPIYERVLRILRPIRERDELFLYFLVGSTWLLGFCAVFLVLPALFLGQCSGYALPYLLVFGIAAVIKGIPFRRRMIAEGLDPKTEFKRIRIWRHPSGES